MGFGNRLLYIIALNDDYGRAYVQELKTAASNRNITFVGEEFYDRAATDFRTVVTKATTRNPDAIVLIGFGRSMGLCIRQLRELGYTRPFVASLGFILTSDAMVAAGEAMRGGYFLNFTFVSEPGAVRFKEKYRLRYGQDPAPNAVIDYGTIYLLAQGIRALGDDPVRLAPYFRGLVTINLPTGDVSVSPHGDIIAPVRVETVPPAGPITLWKGEIRGSDNAGQR
ncbi:MAG: ABC transporter substrate-binding protein [Nitrososphaera sp.]